MSTPPVTPTTRPTQRRRRRFGWPVYAWSLWDWGSAAFNAVITTFVFTVYITSDAFGPGAAQQLGWALAGAGALIALCAPVAGLRSDRSGRRTFWLGFNTVAVVVVSASLFFVQPDPGYLWLGLILLATGNIFFEFASVNYYAMLNELSTPSTIGRVSGLGWGLGYIGGIVLLLIVYFGLINPEVGIFGITSDNGMDVRVTMLICAVWTLVFSLPVLLTVRDDPAARANRPPRLGLIGSYRLLFSSVANVWRQDHHTVYFLAASAIFRDGLAGVFTFGGVIAATVFGFSAGEVIIFGVAANLVAGVATISFGALDDLLGPKRVIVGSLIAMIAAGLGVFFLHEHGAAVFWSLGLLLCVFVGPAQSASRTFLARLIPKGKEGELFGLYATTGRAVSFLAPASFSLAISLGVVVTGLTAAQAEYWGILGIIAVLTLGLLLLLPVRVKVRSESALREPPPA